MGHWLPGDKLTSRIAIVGAFSVRTEVAPLSGRQLAGLPGGPARSMTGCSGRALTGSPSAPTNMSVQRRRPVDSARLTAHLDHLQHRRPAVTRALLLQP
jgi:hypothetical protein